MKIWINGELREHEGQPNVGAVVESIGLPAPTLLVEHNGEALRREEWPLQTLAEGDRLEIIRIVAGG